MTGITYAIAEIILLLAVATGIGFAIGRLTARATPAVSSDASRVKDLEAQVASLTAASTTAVEPAPTDAALRKDLEVATWEIEALQEEVVRLRNSNPEAAAAADAETDDADDLQDDDVAEDDSASEVAVAEADSDDEDADSDSGDEDADSEEE
ncbi:MAG: hypothetical protein HKN07_03520 [Acidimicrobiia bacterium]|nr:hypothetical protein [Acidimicrobiia bacterium]NNF63304.1 hypothetical protein [Acidimicrobiia bacterium]